MSRAFDYEERRQQLIDATREVIIASGFKEVSARNVARRAGVSLGSLRYIYPRQEDLVVEAGLNLHRRFADAVAAGEGSGEDDLRSAIAMLEGALPLDEPRTEALLLLVAFLDYARFSDGVRDGFQESWLVARNVCRFIVGKLAGVPFCPANQSTLPDPLEHEAELLHVFWDGIGMQSYIAPTVLPPERGRQLMTEYITELDARLSTHPRPEAD